MEISIAEFKRKYPGIRKYTTDTLGTIEDIIDVRGGYGDALLSLSKLDKKKCKEIQQTLNTEFTGIRTMIVGAIEDANPQRAEFNVSTLAVKVDKSKTIGDNVFSNFDSKYDAERKNILKQFKMIDDFFTYNSLPNRMKPTAFRIISNLVNIIKSLDVLIALNNNIGTYLDSLPDRTQSSNSNARVAANAKTAVNTKAQANARVALHAKVQGANTDTVAAASAARGAVGSLEGRRPWWENEIERGGKRRTHRKRTHRKRKHTRRH